MTINLDIQTCLRSRRTLGIWLLRPRIACLPYVLSDPSSVTTILGLVESGVGVA